MLGYQTFDWKKIPMANILNHVERHDTLPTCQMVASHQISSVCWVNSVDAFCEVLVLVPHTN